ncbi:MAG TPA: pyridoxal phosphate-dependent aminotransferase [Fibrobacteria bacterium]|nr:pyridoxal phosphate-dependent aminotransferase [Fibrobacteria bacterium]
MKSLSSRARGISPSPTVAVDARYKELLAAGRDVVSLGAGEPDLPMPGAGLEAAVRALRDGKTRYAHMAGLPELRAALSLKFARENGIRHTAEEIIVTSGAKQAVFTALTALLDPGDEVIVPSPFWVTYPEAVRLLGGVPVEVATRFEDGFRMTPEALRAAITPRTKLVLINSPGNPTGAVYSRAELEALAAVIVEHDLFVLSDEIYEHITYGDATHVSPAALSPAMAARTATINGFSKAFAMQGLRLGYVGAPAAWAKAMVAVQSHAAHHPSTISQHAALACLEASDDILPAMRAHYAEARTYALARLSALRDLGVRWNEPDGAFYVFLAVDGLLPSTVRDGAGTVRTLTTSVHLAEYLLDEQGLVTVPGLGFGREGYLRLSFANSVKVLAEGFDRLERGLRALAHA